MPLNEEQAALVAETMLETIETFVDTAPALADLEIQFGEITPGEAPTVRLMECLVAGERFLLVAKRVG